MFASGPDGAPRPLVGVDDEARADRVVTHVFERRRVVVFVVDDPGREALREERALASEPRVVLARIVALEPLDGRREPLNRAVDHGVVVRRHQAVGVEAERPPLHGGLQERDESAAVLVVTEERRPVHRAGGHVEVPVRKRRAKESSHRTTVRPRCRDRLVATQIRTTNDSLRTRSAPPRRVSDTRRGPEGHGSRG